MGLMRELPRSQWPEPRRPAYEESLLVVDWQRGEVLWQDVADREAHWLRAVAVSDDGRWLVLVRPTPGLPAWPEVRVLRRADASHGFSPYRCAPSPPPHEHTHTRTASRPTGLYPHHHTRTAKS